IHHGKCTPNWALCTWWTTQSTGTFDGRTSGVKNGIPFWQSSTASKDRRCASSQPSARGYTVNCPPRLTIWIPACCSARACPDARAVRKQTFAPLTTRARAISQAYRSAPPACGCQGSRQLTMAIRRRDRSVVLMPGSCPSPRSAARATAGGGVCAAGRAGAAGPRPQPDRGDVAEDGGGVPGHRERGTGHIAPVDRDLGQRRAEPLAAGDQLDVEGETRGPQRQSRGPGQRPGKELEPAL